jgi:hypothetical protein
LKRKLLFGATLACALLSIYAGLFGWSVAQYVLIAASVGLAVWAVSTPGDGESQPPSPR